MELRATNSEDDRCRCYQGSKCSNTASACKDHRIHPSAVPSPSLYSSSFIHDVTRENIAGDCERIMSVRSTSNQDLGDNERKNIPHQCDHKQVSSDIGSDRIQGTKMFSERILPTDGVVSLEMDSSSEGCVRTSWQMRCKMSVKNSSLFLPLRKNCVIEKHSRPVYFKKRARDLTQNVSYKSPVLTDQGCNESRLFSNFLIDGIANTESLTMCRTLKRDHHTAENSSHLPDLGPPSNTTNDSERTTPLHSLLNDGAIACNKALSVHPLHPNKELSINGNPALRSSSQSSLMMKNSERTSLDITTGHQEKTSLISLPNFAGRTTTITTHGRLSKEAGVCQRVDGRNLGSFEMIGNSRKLAPRREKERKFRACGRRKLKRRRREYGRLRDMVPALKAHPAVSKVTLIEEAVKYIEELHGALIQRFRARGLPPTLAGSGLDRSDVGEGNIRDLVVQLLTECNPGCLPPTRLENNRTKLKLQVSRPKVFDRRS